MISSSPSYRLLCSCLNLAFPLLSLIFHTYWSTTKTIIIWLYLFIFFGELRSSLPWINWAIQPPVQTNRLFRTYLTLYFSRVHTSNLCMPIIPSSLYLLFQLNFLCHLLNILSYWYLIYLGFKSSLGVICMQVTCKIVELDGKQKVAETLVKFYNYLNMTYKVTLCLLLC